jgi:hypothetical protein
MKNDRKLLKLIQKRVANIAIGASSLRGQGPTGTIQKARNFMAKLNLRNFKDITNRQFERRLDKHTKGLMKQFPKGARRNWGGARKAMNVFLEAVFYDRLLARAYKLQNLKHYLELPLDRYVVRELKTRAGKGNLPGWAGIKNLTPANSKEFQGYGKKVAREKGIPRIYLDLYYWRA